MRKPMLPRNDGLRLSIFAALIMHMGGERSEEFLASIPFGFSKLTG